MKRIILVLEKYSHSHNAALAFIIKMGWALEECEFVFCHSFENMFARLITGPAYAVLPIHNSIAQEVTRVTGPLAALRQQGYDLREIASLVHQVDQYLLVPQHVERAEDLERVLSIDKAFEQCGRYLQSIGLHQSLGLKSSTAWAAKIVSKSKSSIGAIATREAADAYPELKILAGPIQDQLNNPTTFVLVQNEVAVKSVTVGIIGIKGRFGQLLRPFFEELGCRVIGSGRTKESTGLSSFEVVEQADVVVISVDIFETPEVIRSVNAASRPDQLFMDVTGVKQPAMEAMLESQAQVVGLHPMFRPEVPFEGQTVVVCAERLDLPHWKTWVMNVLTATKSRLKWCGPHQHDQFMTTVQVLPHEATLTSAVLIAESGISVSESLGFTSPFYRLLFSLMGRLLGQNPEMYTSVMVENPETVGMLERRISIDQRLLEMIRSKDRLGIHAMFAKARRHFGEKVIREADELFMRMLAVFNTLYGPNTVTLEFAKGFNHPGLLERILGVFSHHGINLAGINFVSLDGTRMQFTIKFDESRTSERVQAALEEIGDWPDPKIKILE
jgi:prephenate dehydrogenase